jgi:hypothetical protein
MVGLGIDAVSSLYERLMLDEQSCVSTERRFMWSYMVPQHIESRLPAAEEELKACPFRIWAAIVEDVDAGRNPATSAGALNLQQMH